MVRQINFYPAPMGARTVNGAVLLRRALAHLQAKGWYKGHFYDIDGGGGSCALGAIASAMGDNSMNRNEYRRAEQALLQHLKAMHPELTAETIPELNDDPAVTYDDITAAFEKAALQLEEKVE